MLQRFTARLPKIRRCSLCTIGLFLFASMLAGCVSQGALSDWQWRQYNPELPAVARRHQSLSCLRSLRLDLQVSDITVGLDQLWPEWFSIDNYVLEMDVLDRVPFVISFQFNSDGVCRGRDIPEGHVLDMSAFGVAAPEGFINPKRHQPRRFLDPQILEAHIAN